MSAVAAPAAAFQSIRLVNLTASTTNPRRRFDESKLRELADSIAQQGILEPLLVRPGARGQFEIVAGERRFRAAGIAGLKEAPCIVRDLTDIEALEIQVVENLQREDVHPLDEALGYKRLLEMDGYDVTAIATKVGRSASYIYQRLKLVDLIERAQAAFADDKLQAGHALLIARLSPEQQGPALDFVRDDTTVANLRYWIEREFHLDLHAAPFKKDDATLVPEAGSCDACPKRTGNNPLLFDDVKKGDTCTDPACFAAKLDAHVANRKTELQAKHQDLIQISTSYSFYGPKGKELEAAGVLPIGQYERVKKGDAGAVPAVLVDDYKPTDLGKLVYVKLRKSTGTSGTHQSRSIKKEREAAKKAKAANQLAAAIAEATFLAAIDRVKELTPRILQTVILPWLADNAFGRDELWKRAIGNIPLDGHTLASRKLTPTQLAKSIVFLALPNADEFEPTPEEAKALGIDPKAIAARVTKEHEAKNAPAKGKELKFAKKGAPA